MGPENLLAFTRSPSMMAIVNVIHLVDFFLFCSSELSVDL